MPLPVVSYPRETVTLSDGSTVEVRGLSRGEAFSNKDLLENADVDIRKAEVTFLALGTDTPYDEADGWYDLAQSADVEAIVDKVMELSRLRPDDPNA